MKVTSRPSLSKASVSSSSGRRSSGPACSMWSPPLHQMVQMWALADWGSGGGWLLDQIWERSFSSVAMSNPPGVPPDFSMKSALRTAYASSA